MVPLTGVGVLAAGSASDKRAELRITSTIDAEADRMNDLMEARTAVTTETIATTVLTRADDLGATPAMLLEAFGVDYEALLADARERVDASAILHDDPTFAAGLAALHALRPEVDRAATSFDEAVVVLFSLTDAIDESWLDGRAVLDETLAGGAVPDTIEARVDALRRMFETFTAGVNRIAIAEDLVINGVTATGVRDLVAADTQLNAGLLVVRDDLGPKAASVFHDLRSDESTHRFDAAIDRFIVEVMGGRTPTLVSDPTTYGVVFSDGARWFGTLSELVGAVSADLGDVAHEQATADARALRTVLVLTGLVVGISLVAIVLLSRSISRPLRRIGAAVQAVHDGSFDLPTMAATGPRELVETAIAVNEMATTLGAVEARAVALADGLDHSSVLPPLPGRTGQALQTTLDRLQNLATHDDLTGLLNRSAALDAMGRDFARARRDGSRVMALFVDLDGLKEINDTFGHHAGDDAIALVATALRDASREVDVVARIGGDEFLVAGIVHERDEEVATLAARVRAEIEHAVLCVDGADVAVRCSVGMAVADPHTSTVEALVDEADTAMYGEKLTGRRSVA